MTASYLNAPEATELILSAVETGEAVVVLVLMPPSAEAGGRIVIRRAPDGTLARVGGSGDDILDSALQELARNAMEGAEDAHEGVHSLGGRR